MVSKSRFLLLLSVLGLVGLMGPAASWANKVPPPPTPGPDPASICDAVAGNIVTNCGFEASATVATGWTLSDTVDTFVDTVPNSGVQSLAMGTVGADGTVSQLLNTVAGNGYNISFYLASDGGTPSDFSAMFGATTLVSLTNTAAGAYTLYSFHEFATSASTLLNFNERNDPGFWELDDVSVVSTPEPGSLGLLSCGLVGLLGWVKKTRK
jgi:hypothetical protein